MEEFTAHLIEIYECLDILPEFEICLPGARIWQSVEYMSLSPAHHLAPDDIAIQFEGCDIIRLNRYQVVEMRYI